ncbi:Bug family tripartite tricarboxylate transporter substrate binding protein [Sabulicella glaciei]|uniref:Tripartite tricarboxylate transporter substrate binding protein n=1 Tax=Sabulicella glaciei TaxID=2984948 RepID=A0ABT3NXI8_9PROT|nr:tripartite tricarboxylate transporter substrate binding protein [Roseococcus sp. MDT2-1-1]MCW8086869.1 tripartite tricarboxylate transporter substrate binding protein [Roseococcus sp. MDT2-1-1]
MSRRAALAGLSLGLPALAQAETWPGRPVTLVVAQGPGSGSDISARLLAGPMGAALGQPVVVENRTGGGGAIAHQSVARAQPDGNTIIFSSTAALLVLPLINPNLRYAMEDFTAVAPVLRAPFAILASTAPGAPATLAELVARLRRDRTAYASAGVGTMTHLAAEAFLRRAGVEAVHVPYRGSGAALTDLIGGQVVFAADSLTASMPHIAGGRLRALAVTGERREAALPDVPTLAEAGLPGPPIAVLGGLFAPRATPEDRVARLAAATDRALADPEVAARFQASQTEILREGREEFVARLREEEPAWRALVRQLDLRLE